MADNNEPSEEKKKQTLSESFDEIYTNFKQFVNNSETTSIPSAQDHLYKTIHALEYITVNVSTLDMFSINENYNEMDPRHLKFLLLPYMLGVLWQLSSREKRKDICRISQVYFMDFLKRCVQYEFIQGSHHLLRLRDDDDDDEEIKKVTKPSLKLSPDEKRRQKVAKFKENKELDEKIEAYKKFASKYDAEDDDSTTYSKEIYVSVIKRAINDSEDQLESIEMEKSLIKFHEESEKGESSSSSTLATSSPPRIPLKPFIITKDAAQKAVYGMGYPALPIMTVEELYQQRRETGEWGPPATGNAPQRNPEDDALQAEQEARVKEVLEDRDDEDEIARKRDYDEYKDDHRRGWGNRFNRS